MTTAGRRFERKPCPRCGGSGHYSYNQIDGSRCYGCNGKGEVLTARGEAAYRWFKAQRTVKVADLKVGDYIGTPGGGKFVIHEIRPSAQTGKSLQPDGSWKDSPPYIDVLPRPGSVASALCAFADTEVELIPKTKALRNAELNLAFDYQETLNEKGKPRK